MEQLIKDYINSKTNAWSPTTLKSEQHRLKFLVGQSLDVLNQPETIYNDLKGRGMKPYAIKTTFIRVGELAQFALEAGKMKAPTNTIKAWYRANANKFKHVYEPSAVGLSFEEAKAKIDQIDDLGAREAAMSLLVTGVRAKELLTMAPDGSVVGKGGMKRTPPTAKEFRTDWDRSYTTLRYHLNKVGLNAHDLRKVCARTLAEQGATITDLMHFFGWRSPQMAINYIEAYNAEKLGQGLKSRLEAATTTNRRKENGTRK